jgi:hypothetical protein
VSRAQRGQTLLDSTCRRLISSSSSTVDAGVAVTAAWKDSPERHLQEPQQQQQPQHRQCRSSSGSSCSQPTALQI